MQPASRWAALISALAALAMCCCCNPARAEPDSNTSESSGVTPFTLSRARVLLSVRINGQGPYTFQLDSAAERNVIDKNLAATLALKTSGSIRVNSFGAALITVPETEQTAVAIGQTILLNQSFLVLDLATTPIAGGLPIQGILGSALFKSFVVHLDHAHTLIALTPAAQFSYRGHGVIVPLALTAHGVPIIEAAINDAGGLFEVDTGQNGGVLLYPQFVAKNRTKFPDATPDKIVSTPQIGGLTREVLVPSAAMRLGQITATISPLELLLSTPPHVANQDIAGNIGESVLQNFTVTFDYKDKLLILDMPGL